MESNYSSNFSLVYWSLMCRRGAVGPLQRGAHGDTVLVGARPMSVGTNDDGDDDRASRRQLAGGRVPIRGIRR